MGHAAGRREAPSAQCLPNNNHNEVNHMDIKDALFFDKMLTPKIITIVYWIGLAVLILGAVVAIFTGEFLIGLGMLFSVLFARIWCELMIVAFKMNEALQVLKSR